MQVKRQSNGQVITLGSVIASGGEGAIREFPPDSSLVAKVYKDDKLKDIDSDKLQLMLANPPDDSVKKITGVSRLLGRLIYYFPSVVVSKSLAFSCRECSKYDPSTITTAVKLAVRKISVLIISPCTARRETLQAR